MGNRQAALASPQTGPVSVEAAAAVAPPSKHRKWSRRKCVGPAVAASGASPRRFATLPFRKKGPVPLALSQPSPPELAPQLSGPTPPPSELAPLISESVPRLPESPPKLSEPAPQLLPEPALVFSEPVLKLSESAPPQPSVEFSLAAVAPSKPEKSLAESYEDIPYIDEDDVVVPDADPAAKTVDEAEAHYFTEDLRWSLTLLGAYPCLAEGEEFPDWAASAASNKLKWLPHQRLISLFGILRIGKESRS